MGRVATVAINALILIMKSQLLSMLIVTLCLLFGGSFPAASAWSQGNQAAIAPIVELTPEERAWLAENHTVRVRVSDWPPYMITQPMPSGVAVDYFEAIAKRIGFKVEFVPSSLTWSESMADVRGPRQHFDLLLTMNRTNERAKEFALTDDYLTAPWVVYTRNDTPYIAGLESLGGKTVASEKGYVITNKIRTDYPEVRILEVDRSQQALEAVSTGQADAYVGNLAIANYLIRQNRFTNLVVAAPTPYGQHTQAMGIRNDWPALASLINKELAAIPTTEINAINQKWGAVEVLPQIDYRLVWQVVAGATAIFLAFFYWNRRLTREVTFRQRIEIELSEEKSRLQQAQQALQHLNQTLEGQVRQRTTELESANAFNETILLDSPVAMVVYHGRGPCVSANQAFARLVGATREQLLAQDFHKIKTLSKTGLLDDFLKALAEKRQYRREIRTLSSFDREIWADCLLFPTILNGEPHLLVQLFDLTEIRKATEAMREAQERAEAANRAKSEFLANMSHEIRTPMNAIIGLSHLALNLDLTPKLRDYLNKISRSAQALLAILDDILDYSKVEAGRLELDATAFHLMEVLETVVQLFSVRADEQGLALKVEISPDAPQWLIGDPLRLGQVLTNLIGNAIKFTASGAVRVQVESIADEPGFATLRFTVQDTGIGISATEVQHLFQPFTQADGSITRRFGGTGLGLAISQRLVRLMGSNIEVASAPGQGSTFSFTIRLALSEQEPTSRRTLAALPCAWEATTMIRGARILLVEDNAINQQVAREILERWGLLVVVAGDGEQALAALADSGPFDAVLMDIHMPVMDGLEATRRIRRDERFRDLPILAMTAAVMAKDQAECREAGMNDHVAKPIRPEQLLGVLERWIVLRERAMPARQNQPKAWSSGSGGSGDWPDALPGFDLSQAIRRVSGNRELLLELLRQFGAQFATARATLAGLMGEDQREEALRWVHQLKGVAGHLGATEVYRHAAALEQELQAGQFPASQTALDQALGVALSAVAAMSPLPVSTDATGNESHAAALLQTLRTLLDQGEFIPLELVAELQNALPDPALQDDLTRLKDQVVALDYLAAGHTLDRLISAVQPPTIVSVI